MLNDTAGAAEEGSSTGSAIAAESSTISPPPPPTQGGPSTATRTFETSTPATTLPSASLGPGVSSSRAKFTPFNPLDPSEDLDTTLSGQTRPVTNATLTIRCIKSFEYRTERNLVIQGLDLTRLTVGELMDRCRNKLKTAPGFKAYRTVNFDTLKLYTQAHSHKTMNLIINLDHDDWILSDMDKTLAECGAVNETEYSFFNREAYEAFKKDPQVKWD